MIPKANGFYGWIALAGAALAAEAPARCSAALVGLLVATMAKVEAMILCVK